MVGHVKMTGIFMIINGCLNGVMGVGLAFMGPFMNLLAIQQGNPQMGAQEQEIFKIIGIVYLSYGIVILITTILNVIGGIMAIRFRHRIFVIVTLFTNVIPIITMWCAPNNLAIMVFGLIVFFNADVAKAFAMVAQGLSPAEAIRRLTSQRVEYVDDVPPA